MITKSLVPRLRRIVSLVFTALSLSVTAEATTTVSLADRDLITSAVAIVVGEVTAIESHEAPDGQIFTHVTVDVEDVVHGDLPRGPLTLKQLGGAVGDRTLWIEGSPEFFLGERALLFLRKNADGTLRVAHLYQGKFSVFAHQNSGLDYAYQQPPEGVNVVAPPSGAALAPSVRLRQMDDFKREIRQLRRGQGPRASHFDTVTAPTAPAGSMVSSTDAFTYLGTPSRWFEPDAGIPVRMMINVSGEPAAPGLGFDAVRAAFAAWSNVPGSSFRFEDGGFTSAVGFRSDGVSAISFRDPLGQIDAPSGCGGTLAIGGYSRGTSETRVINGQTFRRIQEGDVVIADGWTGCGFYENLANFAEVLTHELGHAIGLGHSADSAATMAPFAHFDGRGGSLRADDIAAVTFMYPGTAAPLAVSFVNPKHGTTVSGTTTVTLSASGGTGLTYTVTVDGATVYSGANPTFSWNTSGLTNGSHALVATVRDAANRTATASATVTLNNVASSVSLTASPASTTAGTNETVTWSGIAAPTATDWIALYVPGTPDGVYLAWRYVSCSQTPASPLAAGSCAFPLPGGLAPRTYEFRLFASNSYTRLATSATITVTAPTPASLSATPASTAAGTNETVTWSGIVAPTATDWIALYIPGTPNEAYLAWNYVSCSQSPLAPMTAGSCVFPLPSGLAPRTYEFRLFTKGTYTRLATSAPFTITAPAAATLSATPLSAAAGTNETVTWSGIVVPTATDWIALYVPGTSDQAYLAWTYLSCVQQPAAPVAAGACAFPLPSSLAPRTYEVRLFANGSYTRLATSAPFTVTPPAASASLTASPASAVAGTNGTASWSGITGPTATDWIALYVSGASDQAYLAWTYVSCSQRPATPAATGSCALPLPGELAPGTYEFRLFASGSYTRLATSAPFTITR